MSIKLMAHVWELDLPPGEKLVLLALADQANDAGRQCWPSVATIAHRSGQGERTVRRAFAELEKKGHLTRNHREGDSTQYHVHPCHSGTPAKLAPLPKTTGTPAKLAGKPSRTTIPKKDKPSLVRAKPHKHRLPDDWQPKEFTPGTQCAGIIALWQPGRIERELSKFRASHTAKGNRFEDWQAAWKTWVLNSVDYERNGRGGNEPANGLRGSRPDPSLDFYRQGKAREAAEGFGDDPTPHRGTGASLPAIGTG